MRTGDGASRASGWAARLPPGCLRPIAVPLLASTLASGCGPRAAPERPEPAPTTQPLAAARPRPAPPPEVCRCITFCIVQNGELRDIPIDYDPQTGDTTTREGLPLSQVAPLTGEYAAVAGWYVEGSAIRFRGRRYSPSGHPRVLGRNEIERVGMRDRVPLFAERGDTAAVPVLYLPVRPGCVFQPYTPAGWKRDAR